MTCIVEGGIFWINIDDSEEDYPDLNEPEIKRFFNGEYLPKNILCPNTLKDEQNYSKLLKEAGYEGSKISPNFQVAVWTRLKVKESTSTN